MGGQLLTGCLTPAHSGPLSTASTPPGTVASSPTTQPPGRWSQSWWPSGCHPLASAPSTTWAPVPSAFPSSSCSGSSRTAGAKGGSVLEWGGPSFHGHPTSWDPGARQGRQGLQGRWPGGSSCGLRQPLGSPLRASPAKPAPYLTPGEARCLAQTRGEPAASSPLPARGGEAERPREGQGGTGEEAVSANAGRETTPGAVFKRLGGEGGSSEVTDLGFPSVQSLILTVCVSQSQANARAIQGLRKQLVWVSVI